MKTSSAPAPKLTEEALGVPIKAWFEAHGWTVYQEVEHGPGIADIVATLGPLLAVVELKVSLTFDVIAQARRWLPWAHWSWVAVPSEKGSPDHPSDGRRLAYDVCASKGIGVLRVRPLDPFEERSQARGDQYRAGTPWCFESNRVRVVAQAAIQRRANVVDFRSALKPEHQTFAAAGMQNGKRWTPFQDTCEKMRAFLVKAGGSAPLAEVIKGIEHHYASGSSGRASVMHWAERKKIEGVQLDLSGAKPVLRAVAAGSEAPIQKPRVRARAVSATIGTAGDEETMTGNGSNKEAAI